MNPTPPINADDRATLEALMASCAGNTDGRPELITMVSGTRWAITNDSAWTMGRNSTLITADRTDGGF